MSSRYFFPGIKHSYYSTRKIVDLQINYHWFLKGEENSHLPGGRVRVDLQYGEGDLRIGSLNRWTRSPLFVIYLKITIPFILPGDM